jgi:hypothetical protein
MTSDADSTFERQQRRIQALVPAALRTLAEIAAGPPSKAQRAAGRALRHYLKKLEPPRGPKQ